MNTQQQKPAKANSENQNGPGMTCLYLFLENCWAIREEIVEK